MLYNINGRTGMLHFFCRFLTCISGSTLIPIPTTLKFQLNQKRKNAETINFVQLFINFNYNLTELNGILNDYSSRVAFFREKFIFSFFHHPKWMSHSEWHALQFVSSFSLLYWYAGGYFTFYLDTPSFKFSGTFNIIERLNYSQFLLPNAICLFIFQLFLIGCAGFFSVAQFNCTDTFQTTNRLPNFPPKIEGFPYWNWHFLLSVWFEFDQVKKKWNII